LFLLRQIPNNTHAHNVLAFLLADPRLITHFMLHRDKELDCPNMFLEKRIL